ncbi:MAG: radical SAM family heme chaperone HemW [Bacteroidales bacterium]|nr:radical SAM family heme chaperone HemW [Bacteroidales bacterium]
MANVSSESRWAEAIVKEYEMRRGEVPKPNTIYIGGGTPSILSEESLAKVIEALPVSDLEEFTIEANPEDVTVEKARFWRSLGIDRVSMGVQSLCDAELKIIGRRHTAAEAEQAIKNLREAGFDNISIDLIYGLPGQDLVSWQRSLTRLLDFRPEHFSAYILSYEPKTRLSVMLRRGEVCEATEDEIGEMYDFLCVCARDRGYDHYEISNFCLPGREARHNSSYWRDEPYLGLGPSAHSFDGSCRRYNPSNLKEYLAKIESGLPAYEIEKETPDNRFNDLLMVTLRTRQGLPLASVPTSRLPQLLRDASPWLASGSLILTSTHLFIPEPHLLISDSIISSLMQ